MEKHLRKSQSLYSLSYILFFVCCFVFAGIGFLSQMYYFYIPLMILAVLAMIMHWRYVKKLQKSLFLLIGMTESIIEQKNDPLPLIDGESYIAVLSSHLQLLNTRMQGMLERLQQEQNNLKNYIEDISHQMKTPLTALMLKEDILLELTEGKQHQLTEQMIAQTQRLFQCIESLLHLAQIESHTLVYHKQDYALNELINSVEEHLKPLLEEYDVSLQKPQEDVDIYCDFQWMGEAIENILKNCIEQKQHTSIDITCQEFTTYHQILIHDHGDGILERDRIHLFDRFYQSQYQKKPQGIGIGLAITKGIIEDHHGTIDVTNDDGAVFQIMLPKRETKNKYTVTIE